VPGILGTNIIRGDIERMMGAVLAHLDKQPSSTRQAMESVRALHGMGSAQTP